MSELALVAEILLLEHGHFTGKSVRNRFAQQAVRILSMAIKLGVRKTSTLWLSHTPGNLREPHGGPRATYGRPGQAVAARAKRGKRGVLLAAPELWLLPSHASGRVAPPQL